MATAAMRRRGGAGEGARLCARDGRKAGAGEWGGAWCGKGGEVMRGAWRGAAERTRQKGGGAVWRDARFQGGALGRLAGT